MEKRNFFLWDFNSVSDFYSSCSGLPRWIDYPTGFIRVRDYIFNENERKYVFHWMDKDNNLIIRWDNSEHWPSISTFPHHKHLGAEKKVQASTEVLLEDVLEYIQNQISVK